MNDPALPAALARGALVVTPNNRLARDVVAQHDRVQREAGRAAWPSARALPWSAFVGELWQQALDAGLALPPHRLDAGQASHLWRRAVGHDLGGDALLDATAAAVLAEDAWERLHAFGEGGPSWRGFSGGGAEVAAFVRWATAFERETNRLGALDFARAPDAIATQAARLPAVATLDIVCAGFVERSPQQQRLLEAFVRAGARVQWSGADAVAAPTAHGGLFAAASPRDELVAALAWARRHAEEHPGANVGIVVHDLHERRALVQSLAEDVLSPGLQWPGRERMPRGYDISAGVALADVPIVAAAIDLVALAHRPLERAQAATLVRSRYLPGAPSLRAARAAIERRWVEQGSREVTLAGLTQGLGRADPELAARWRAASRHLPPARGTPREFVEAWRRWLEAAGWCEGEALDAPEGAARGAWNELLAGFVRLATVAPRMTRDEALQSLRNAAQRQPFEPEAPGARIRILGVLEAAGLAFDAVWIAGLTAEAWPRAPEPSPLLPIDWQRERNVPRSTPARELAYARALTARLDAAAPTVVFSYATTIDDHKSLPSPLIAHLRAYAAPLPLPRGPARTMFERKPALERIADERAPRWRDGAPYRGGAALIEAQSACPFQATGRFRLRAEGWPDAYAGLAPTERGKFVHAAFAAFWREVREQGSLAALDAAGLARHVAKAVTAGRAALDDLLWDALPPVVAAVETGHVARLMTRWLDGIDRARPAFCVEATELAATLTLAGHPLPLRIDRIDTLADGRRAIIDYKTGLAIPPELWFAERPQAPQLALYAMAVAQEGTPVAALAYAQLKPGQVKAVGIADTEATWPGLPALSRLKRVPANDWDQATARLREAVAALAQDVHDGDARVAPRDAKVCSRCELAPLCRIAALDETDDGAAAETVDA